MRELELTRAPGDRRLYALEGVGTLRLKGLASRTASAEAGAGDWRIGRRRFWERVIQATDAEGTEVGEFEPRSLRRGGALRWAGREFTLRPASCWPAVEPGLLLFAAFVVRGLAEDAGGAAGAGAGAAGSGG